MAQEQQSFRRVNRALGGRVKLGWFSAGQIVPLICCAVLTWIVYSTFKLPWLESIMFGGFLMTNVLILTGKKPWRLWLRFWHTPIYYNGFTRNRSLLGKKGKKSRR